MPEMPRGWGDRAGLCLGRDLRLHVAGALAVPCGSRVVSATAELPCGVRPGLCSGVCPLSRPVLCRVPAGSCRELVASGAQLFPWGSDGVFPNTLSVFMLAQLALCPGPVQ